MRPRHERRRQLEHAGVSLVAKGETCCRNCGYPHNLNLHHVIPRSKWKGGIQEPLNCIALCTSCHLGWHHERVIVPRSVFTEEEWEFLCAAPLLGQNVQPWLERRYPERVGSAL